MMIRLADALSHSLQRELPVASARFLAAQLHELGYKSVIGRSGLLRRQMG